MYQKRNNWLKIVGLYSQNYRHRLYLREISRSLDLPTKTTFNNLIQLEKENILKSKMEGKNKYFSLNLLNVETKLVLLQAELEKTRMFLQLHPEFKSFLRELRQEMPTIIFGSFAKGTEEKTSDVDILVINKGKKELPEHLLPHKIHRIIMKPTAFVKNIKNQEPLIKEIEEKHVILTNHSYYVDRMWKYYAK